jgi:hypothetical protein
MVMAPEKTKTAKERENAIKITNAKVLYFPFLPLYLPLF